MILAIDAHKLAITEKTGTDTVLHHFVRNLNDELTGDFKQIILYTKQAVSSEISSLLPRNTTIKQINFPFLWTSLGLSLEMYFHSPDIFFSPSHLLPFRIPEKSCLIVHDIGFLQYPENYHRKELFYLQQSVPRDLKKASVVLVPSQYVKKSIIDTYYTDPNKINVVPLGIDHNFFQHHQPQEKVSQIFSQYHPKISRHPYIFFIGRIDFRKNIINLIRAFAIFKKQADYPHILVLGGKPGVGYDQIIQEIADNNLTEDIIITDYIPDDHLPVFYSEAELFLFPTFYEGFGIPILEAQSCRTPVITSQVSAMPEIAGDGALLVDPANPDEIAHNIKKLVENQSLVQQLVEKGYANCQKYSWEKFTRETMMILTSLGKKL